MKKGNLEQNCCLVWIIYFFIRYLPRASMRCHPDKVVVDFRNWVILLRIKTAGWFLIIIKKDFRGMGYLL